MRTEPDILHEKDEDEEEDEFDESLDSSDSRTRQKGDDDEFDELEEFEGYKEPVDSSCPQTPSEGDEDEFDEFEELDDDDGIDWEDEEEEEEEKPVKKKKEKKKSDGSETHSSEPKRSKKSKKKPKIDDDSDFDDDDDIAFDDDANEEEPDSKNPLGLKVDDKKKIPVRKPKSTDPKRLKIERMDDPDRDEKMRESRLESAKRYESLRLYPDAIKYYTMSGELDDAERVRGIMEDLYLKKAREFEASGSMDEAAHLYDIINMKEEAARCRSQSSVPTLPKLEEDDATSGAIGAFTPMNNPTLNMADPEASPYIAAGQEQVKEMPLKKPKEEQKAFAFCPYCGEDIDLPKPPKFCPYCREPFS